MRSFGISTSTPCPASLSLLVLVTLLCTLPCSLFCLPQEAFGLQPEEVLVVANNRVKESSEIAAYYIKKRGIPAANLITLSTTDEESCDREEYDRQIRTPVRDKLLNLKNKQRIRCLILCYGIPLKIRPNEPNETERQIISILKDELTSLTDDSAEHTLDKRLIRDKLQKMKTRTTRASVDSELALVLREKYPLEGWLPNPYFLGFQKQKTLLKKDEVLIVSRLDGPDPETVKRIIDGAWQTEQKGLGGLACLDARWPLPPENDKKKLDPYALYDKSIHLAAQRLAANKRLRIHLDQGEQLVQGTACADTALYCGWYSLANYVDAFTWQQGAIGYHIASSECDTLKQKDSREWCISMLEDGITATLGPVYEPYVQAFPPPEIFFSVLSEGYLSLGETYLISLPFLSWQMVLIGDPLYLPFKPQEKISH